MGLCRRRTADRADTLLFPNRMFELTESVEWTLLAFAPFTREHGRDRNAVRQYPHRPGGDRRRPGGQQGGNRGEGDQRHSGADRPPDRRCVGRVRGGRRARLVSRADQRGDATQKQEVSTRRQSRRSTQAALGHQSEQVFVTPKLASSRACRRALRLPWEEEAPSRPAQEKPSRSKEIQGNPRKITLGFPWFSLDFLVRIGTFQWVTEQRG